MAKGSRGADLEIMTYLTQISWQIVHFENDVMFYLFIHLISVKHHSHYEAVLVTKTIH